MDDTHACDGLVDKLKRLEESREKHLAALTEIDRLLGRISITLDSMVPTEVRNKPPVTEADIPGDPRDQRAVVRVEVGPRRRYVKLGLTGDQGIVAFVRERGVATTAEINAQWHAEGRGGAANNAIVRLLKRGELVREPCP